MSFFLHMNVYIYILYAFTIVREGRRVKHYKIQKYACGYFIVHRRTFKTLQELVNYYMEVAAIKPCVHVRFNLLI